MNVTAQAVLIAFLVGTPLCLGGLGIAGLRRDRLTSGLLLVVAAVFAAVALIAAVGGQPGGAGLLALLVGGGLALGLRLSRDRRQGHLRSTPESLAVLASGAILLAVLVFLPSILAELARLRGV